jgi:hypothetical protein
LPASSSNVEAFEGSVLGHNPQAIRKGAIAIDLGAFEPREKHWLTEEHSCIQGVVALQILSNVDNAVSFKPDFGCIVQVKDALDFPIDRENDLAPTQRLTEQSLSCGWFKDVIRHEQKEWLVNQILRAQNGNSIVFLAKIRILYPGDIDALEWPILVPLFDRAAVIPDHDDEFLDTSLAGTGHYMLQERLAMKRYKGLWQFS